MGQSDYGLIGGIGQGIQQGLNMYMKRKQLDRDNQIQNLVSGVQTDENGNLQLTPEQQQIKQAQGAQAKHSMDNEDATTPVSQSKRDVARGLLNSQQPGLGDQTIKDTMSGADVDQVSGLIKPTISGGYLLQGKQTTANAAKDIAQGKNDTALQTNEATNQTKQTVADKNIKAAQSRQDQSLGFRQDRNQLAANGQYSHEMGNIENQLLAANKADALAKGISAGDLQGTSQLKSDLSAALSQMIAGGKPPTVYGMSHQEFDSAYGRAQGALGFLTGSTPGTLTDAQLGQLQKDIGALKNEYATQHQAKYKSFAEGLPQNLRPNLDNRFQNFESGVLGNKPNGLLNGQGGAGGQDPKVSQYAQQNGLDYAHALTILTQRGYKPNGQ